jgi:hypothetical protein
MHTNYRLFVLTESDALVLILSARQQSGRAQPNPRPGDFELQDKIRRFSRTSRVQLLKLLVSNTMWWLLLDVEF